MKAKTVNEGIKHLAPRSEEELAKSKKRLKAAIKKNLMYDDVVEFTAKKLGYNTKWRLEVDEYSDIANSIFAKLDEDVLVEAIFKVITNAK